MWGRVLSFEESYIHISRLSLIQIEESDAVLEWDLKTQTIKFDYTCLNTSEHM